MDKVIAIRPFYGNHIIFDYEGAADALSLALLTSPGFCYEVVDLWALHNDTSARALTWSYWDGATALAKTASASIAAGVLHPFKDSSLITNRLVITNLIGVLLTVPALTAGKKIRMQGVFRKFAL